MNLLTNVAGNGRARKILKSEGAGMSDRKLQALLDTCDGNIRDLM